MGAMYGGTPELNQQMEETCADELQKVFSGRYDKTESQGKGLVDQLYEEI